MTYGAKIIRFRKEKGLTQQQVADLLGVSQNTYHRIESDQTQIKAVTLEKIADILSVDKCKLLNAENSKCKIKGNAPPTDFCHNHKEREICIVIEENVKKMIEIERENWYSIQANLNKIIEDQLSVIKELQKAVDILTSKAS
jgi:transcriptional regulator with XRE-family HTH domain